MPLIKLAVKFVGRDPKFANVYQFLFITEGGKKTRFLRIEKDNSPVRELEIQYGMSNMNEQFLTLQEIETYFSERSEMELCTGIQISLLRDLWISGMIWDKNPVASELVFIVRENDPAFAAKLGISSVRELEAVTMEYLWAQYQKGNAQVSAMTYELFEMEIVSRQKDKRTYVCSCDRDETLVEVLEESSMGLNWFRAYVRNNAKRWYEMAEETN